MGHCRVHSLGPRSVCLLPGAWVGDTPPKSLGIWCWIPQLPQKTVLLVGVCQIVVVEGVIQVRGVFQPYCSQEAFEGRDRIPIKLLEAGKAPFIFI